MFEDAGYRVKGLLRIRIGNLRLADLPRGHWRALTQQELKDLHLKKDVGIETPGAYHTEKKAGHPSKPVSMPPATT
jgi:hypothetical protein